MVPGGIFVLGGGEDVPNKSYSKHLYSMYFTGLVVIGAVGFEDNILMTILTANLDLWI